MAHPPTDFEKYAGTEFESYILPIIPAGAKLTEKSKLSPGNLGKIPGIWKADAKAWTGFPSWQTHIARAGHLRYWQKGQTETDTAIALAVNCRNLICFDLDIDDKEVADAVEAFISLEMGASPVVRLRHGSSRRVLFYARDQHTAPIHKVRLVFASSDGKQHLVEVLAAGQQVIAEGPHAKGQMHYWRSGGFIENAEWLRTRLVTGDEVFATIKRLGEWVDATPGMEKIKLSAPTSSDSAAAVRITDLMSPHLAKDQDVLARCMGAIDLDDEQFDYDAFINLLRALCAAVAGDMVFFTEQVWPWVCTQKIARGNGPRSEDQGIEWLETRWRSFTDSQLGAEYVYGLAASFGCNDGAAADAAEQAALLQEALEGVPAVDGNAGGNGLTASVQVAGSGPPAPSGPLPFSDTHLQIANDFAAANQDRWRYDVDSRLWHVHELNRWAADPRVVGDLSALMARMSLQILATVNGPQGAARSRSLESAGTIHSVKRVLEGSPTLTVRNDQWDKDNHLLNTPDGVLDLRNGSLASHDPSLLMRGMTLVTPDILETGNWEAICPKWMALLRQVAYGRPHVDPLLQRWFGYCFTGDIRHQHLLFIQGEPGTGKSQLLTVILLLLESYALSLPQNFVVKSQDGKRFDMVQIIGKRFGFGDEMMKGATWDETRMSKLSTAKRLEAEFKGGANVNFTNTVKLNLAGNHHPHFVSAEAGGLMRRMLLLEMINPPIHGTDADVRDYAQVLVNEEGPGIMAWCVDGARLDYEDQYGLIFNALKQPLMDASRDYARESNPIVDWVDSDMRVAEDADIDLLEAFARYRDFVRREGGIMRDTRRGFKVALKSAYPEVEFAKRTTSKDRGKSYIKGIGVNLHEFEEAIAKVG